MDALIRFCFSWIEPEEINDIDKYAKLYGQAKWVIDYTGLLETKKTVEAIRG